MGHHHHGHGGNHDHSGQEQGGSRLLLSIFLNLTITIAEIVGGLLSGSLALLSDALHNFSDTASLGISYAAQRISRRDANRHKTFGYRRAQVIGAFINLITLVLIALFLMKEAVERFLDPQPVDGSIMMIVALAGLAANLLTAALLFRHAHDNLNFRSAFLHIVTDAVSSVGVVAGGALIIWFDVYILDPILTLAISLYILYHSYDLLRQTIDILMESTPRGLDLDEIISTVKAQELVRGMHHLHVWQLDEQHVALEAHIVIDRHDLQRMEEIKHATKHCLEERFSITHSTLEFEFAPCEEGGDGHCFDHRLTDAATAE